MPSKDIEPKIESPVKDVPAEIPLPVDLDEGEIEEAEPVEPEPSKRSHHKKGSLFEGGSRTRKGSLMDDFLKSAKKVHPMYWVLGLGGAALAIDYFMEGDKSVASSIYRGIFGEKATGHENGGVGRAPQRQPVHVAPASVAIPSVSYAVPYYPAFPPSIYAFPRYPGYAPGFGGRPGIGYGGRMGSMGYGHPHVRGQFPWE